jgi:hypothetical protein
LSLLPGIRHLLQSPLNSPDFASIIPESLREYPNLMRQRKVISTTGKPEFHARPSCISDQTPRRVENILLSVCRIGFIGH